MYVKFQSDGYYSDRGFSFNVSAVLEGKSIITHFVYYSEPKKELKLKMEGKEKNERKREKRKREIERRKERKKK